MTSTVRVLLPAHLRLLAKCGAEVPLEITGPVTQCAVLDALEAQFPMLQGTIRDHTTKRRRAFVRFFACEKDISNEPIDAPLPDKIASGKELFMVIGALAGG
jgi:hypothetical protein